MGRDIPKVLLCVRGRALLCRVVRAAYDAGVERIIVVVNQESRNLVRETLEAETLPVRLEYVVQKKPRGTADALLSCSDVLANEEECVVLYGDAPLISASTIRRLVETRKARNADVAVFTAQLEDPRDYGRVVRSQGDEIERIVEKGEATSEELRIKEVNSGLYSFCWGRVRAAIERIKPSAVSGEYYLTDMVREIRNAGGKAVAVLAEDPAEMLGANTPEDLFLIEQELLRRELKQV